MQVITLNSVSIIVTEFVPFGANQIAQMNTNLGTADRVQGGFFTALIDAESTGAGTAGPPAACVRLTARPARRHQVSRGARPDDRQRAGLDPHKAREL